MGDPGTPSNPNVTLGSKVNVFQLFSIGKKPSSSISHQVLVESSSEDEDSRKSSISYHVHDASPTNDSSLGIDQSPESSRDDIVKSFSSLSARGPSTSSVGGLSTSSVGGLGPRPDPSSSFGFENVSYPDSTDVSNDVSQECDLETVKKKLSFTSILNESDGQRSNQNLSHFSPFLNGSIGNVSITRSKNGRRKSVLGKHTVYLVSSDEDNDQNTSQHQKSGSSKKVLFDVTTNNKDEKSSKILRKTPAKIKGNDFSDAVDISSKVVRKLQTTISGAPDSDSDIENKSPKNDRKPTKKLGKSGDGKDSGSKIGRKKFRKVKSGFLSDSEDSNEAINKSSCGEESFDRNVKIFKTTPMSPKLPKSNKNNSVGQPSDSDDEDLDESLNAIKRKFSAFKKTSRKPSSSEVENSNEESDEEEEDDSFVVPDDEIEEDGSTSSSEESSFSDSELSSENVSSDSESEQEEVEAEAGDDSWLVPDHVVLRCHSSEEEDSPNEKPVKHKTQFTGSPKRVFESPDPGESEDSPLPKPVDPKKFKIPEKSVLSDSGRSRDSPLTIPTKSRTQFRDSPSQVIISSDASDSEDSPISKPVKTKKTPDQVVILSDGTESDESPFSKPVKPVIKAKTTGKKRAKPELKSCPSSAPQARRTFLQSLSLDVDNPCLHPEAVKYLKNFNRHKQELAERLYDLFNREAFSGGLPKDMEIFWGPRLAKTAGRCHSRLNKLTKKWVSRIELSSKVIDSCDRLRDTLIHEMCHAAVRQISDTTDDVHGPVWKSWANRAMIRFPELPLIARCHTYKIRTKYIYKCINCGQQYGRHSKSVDTSKKVCGRCKGKLQLMVASMQNGKYELKPEGATVPKTPNAFAQFVKDNYKFCRTPGSSHKEAMAQLSQQFAKTKIN